MSAASEAWADYLAEVYAIVREKQGSNDLDSDAIYLDYLNDYSAETTALRELERQGREGDENMSATTINYVDLETGETMLRAIDAATDLPTA